MRASAFLLLAAAFLVLPSATARARLHALSHGPKPGADAAPQPGPRAAPDSWLPLFAAPVAGLWIAVMVGFPLGLPIGIAAGWAAHRAYGRWLFGRDRAGEHPLRLAAGWDLLAVGMRAGLPIAVVVRAVAAEFTGTTAKTLQEVAALHELGADPVSAWEPALGHPDTVELARAARRSARTGSGIADMAADVAAAARTTVRELTQKQAERAAVWVAAPLGLCFLPAFLCLGVLPVILGMVQRLHSFQ